MFRQLKSQRVNTFMDHLVRNMYSADKKASASETVIAGSNNQCPCNSAVSCITPFRNHTFIVRTCKCGILPFVLIFFRFPHIVPNSELCGAMCLGCSRLKRIWNGIVLYCLHYPVVILIIILFIPPTQHNVSYTWVAALSKRRNNPFRCPSSRWILFNSPAFIWYYRVHYILPVWPLSFVGGLSNVLCKCCMGLL